MINNEVEHDSSLARGRTAQLAQLINKARRSGSIASVAEILVITTIAILVFRITVTYSSLTTLGIWSLTQSLTAIVRMADTGVTGALSRYVGAIARSERNTKVWDFVDSALILNACFYLLLTAVAWWPLSIALSHSLSPEQAAQAHQLLPVILGNMIFSALQGVPASALIGLRMGASKSLAAISAALVWLGATLLLFPRTGITGLAFAQTCQIAFNFVICMVLLARATGRFNLVPRLNLPLLKSTLGFSFSLQLNTIISQLYEVVLRLALSRFGGASSVAIYELTDRFIKVARQVILLPSLLLIPIISQAFARGRKLAVKRINQRQVRLTTFAAAVIFSALVLVAPLASIFVLGGIDMLYMTFVAIVGVASFINVLSIPAYALGLSSGMLRYNLLGNMVTLVGTMIFANLGGFMFGAVGALVGGATMLAAGSLLITVLNSRFFCLTAFLPPGSLKALARPSEWRRVLAPVLR